MLVGKVRGAQETGARMAGCTGWGLWKIKNESWTRSSEGTLTRVELASPSGRANQWTVSRAMRASDLPLREIRQPGLPSGWWSGKAAWRRRHWNWPWKVVKIWA